MLTGKPNLLNPHSSYFYPLISFVFYLTFRLPLLWPAADLGNILGRINRLFFLLVVNLFIFIMSKE